MSSIAMWLGDGEDAGRVDLQNKDRHVGSIACFAIDCDEASLTLVVLGLFQLVQHRLVISVAHTLQSIREELG